MGYSYYISIISKEVVKDLENLTYDKLIKRFESEYDYFNIQDLPMINIYEFGDLDAVDVDSICLKGRPLFNNEELSADLEHYGPVLVGREGLLEGISIYKAKITSYLKKLLVDDDDNSARAKQEKHIKHTLSEWEMGSAINLNSKESISYSTSYEYAIFELVRLLKTIDFEKDTILFYGR